MASFIKLIGFLSVTLILAYVGWNTFRYFSSLSAPLITVVGLQPGGTYTGKVNVIVKGYDTYKVARMTIKIDGNPYLDKAIGRRSFEYPFVLETELLSEGQHSCEITLENGAYHKSVSQLVFPFFVDNQPLQAAWVKNERDAQVLQGRTLHLQFQTNKEIKEAQIKTLGKSYPCFRESDRLLIYECFVPIDTEEIPKEYSISCIITDRVGNTITRDGTFHVVNFPFKRQTIHIPPEKMKAEDSAGLSEKQFEADVEELAKKSPHEKLWHGRFIMPLDLKDPKQVTSDFGVIRATQERGLRQHKAVDMYAMPKSIVWAPQDGVIVMKGRYAHSGNTIAIDHGWGILSLFFHLDTFGPIEVGDKIKKGNPIGTLGKTGYATGYHLHWELRVNNVPVDPLEWTKPGF